MADQRAAPRLSHLSADGRPAMVDVGDKAESNREAEAEGWLLLGRAAFDLLERGSNPKGDPLLVAQIAGIQAAKRTADLIPLCHTLPITRVDVRLQLDEQRHAVHAVARVRVIARTGVEMEALTAVSVALLTAYDMLKAVDRTMRIEGVRLLRKSGGRSGHFEAEEKAELGTHAQ